tara:strand:- start:1035 stop:1541 length:507 start_codon:yes stop_codon:yes gene_type:complete
MKRTGRTLTLSNDVVNSTFLPTDSGRSITDGNSRLTTIFEDDREGYAWKVVSIEEFPTYLSVPTQGWQLFTTRPDAFASTIEFGVWAYNRSLFSNAFVGTIKNDLGNGIRMVSLKADHMATNHLALFYSERELPTYNITLEEYEISDREEIAFKIKETSQSLNLIGEQ